ncbi:MAG: hypothetical protein MJZ37_09775, partial [Bacilli bacterium]|nr:hypothetical protein [Bacilli bacterium]
ENKELRDNNTELSRQLGNGALIIDPLRKTWTKNEVTIHRQDLKIQNLNQVVEKLGLKIRELKNNHTAEIRELKNNHTAEIQELKESNKELKDRIKYLEDDNKKLRDKLDFQLNVNNKLHDEIKLLHAEKDKLNDEIKQIYVQLLNSTKDNAQLKIEIKNKDNKINELNKKIEELDNKIKELNREIILLNGEDLPMSFKDGSKYCVKVMDRNGSPVPNAKVVITVNSVSYDRYTNNDGIASLAINLNPGTYIITATHGKTIYNTITIK